MSQNVNTSSDVRLVRCVKWVTFIAIVLLPQLQVARAQSRADVHQTLMVTSTEPVVLDVEIANGELQVLYGREGEVSITGFAQSLADGKVDDNFFKTVLAVEQDRNRLKIRHTTSSAYPEQGINIHYRINVPYRTEISSRVNQGKQTVSGIMGPVRAVTGKGDFKASYISKSLQSQVDLGNLDVRVIGEHVDASTGSGNISCERLTQGVTAETGDGDITLMVVGSSTATVKKGTGRIEIGGARGSLIGSTDGGDLHVKAFPHDAWKLDSTSGNIRLELPPALKAELDASTDSGEFQLDRDDIAKPHSDSHHFHQQVNGGAARIDAHTARGRIVIR
jgi:DUF4097 and DUF4098 domain-containing protein YvlB